MTLICIRKNIGIQISNNKIGLMSVYHAQKAATYFLPLGMNIFSHSMLVYLFSYEMEGFDYVIVFSQDWIDIDFAIAENVDFIAVSFVKTADVIKHLKSYIAARSPQR